MKKIFAILMTICLMVSVLSISTSAALLSELDAVPVGAVLRVTAIKGEDTELIGDYDNFVDGWNDAMEIAGDKDEMEEKGYDRIVVDFYADWIANGSFTDSGFTDDGFKNDTIYIPDDAKVTINMKGHTINRGLAPSLLTDGEVIYIDEGADVIINDGTITGGCSENGAGGIHINDEAMVTLNNVNIVGNTTDDDDGGGIAIYDNAILVMNGGSISNNILRGPTYDCYGGAIYINESTATFNGVTFKNNIVKDDNEYGAAIYADESTVTINECIFDGNGIEDAKNESLAAISIIHATDSSITVKKSTFTNNGDLHYEGNQNDYRNVSSLFYLDGSSLIMEGCGVTENTLGHLFQTTDNSEFFISGTNITRNNATVLKSTGHAIDSYFNGCTFGNNNTSSYMGNKYSFLKYSFAVNSPVTFYNCDMGNSTYSNPANIKLINQNLDSGIVLTISGRKADGTIVKIEDHRSFEEGWSAAMRLAIDSYWMYIENNYEAVVVDLHTDWIASKGRFTNAGINGIGFNSDTIHVSEGACLILNMNGYKINRGLTEAEANGEVIYIASGADITINDGTITGGFSNNGAGGIHISGEAKVTLNNVHVDGNKVKGDDGAGIAVYGGATITMNDGSISNNILMRGLSLEDEYGSGIYIENSRVVLTGVTINNNGCGGEKAGMIYGSAIYSTDSTVTLKDCIVEGNGVTKDNAIYFCNSTIYAEDSTIVIENTNFVGNGAKHGWQIADYKPYKGSTVISGTDTDLTITGGKFTDNNQVFLFSLWDAMINVDGVDFTGNNSLVMNVREASAEGSAFANCKFSAGSIFEEFKYDFQFGDEKSGITFVDCDFGKATFNNKNAVTFVGGTVSNGVGSMFGEGSLALIVSFVALVASVAAIVVNVYSNKNKNLAFATDNGDEESDDEE